MSNQDQSSKPTGYFISRAVGEIEALCGVVSSGLLSLAILGTAAFGMMTPWIVPTDNEIHVKYPWCVAGLAIVVLIVELLSLRLMVNSIQSAKSRKLLALAAGHPVLPIPLRPLAFLWWAVHFALIVFLGHMFVPKLSIVEDPTAYQRWMTNLIRVLAAVGVSFCTNSYLMLMFASLTRRESVIGRVFRLRVVADILLCLDLLLPHHGW